MCPYKIQAPSLPLHLTAKSSQAQSWYLLLSLLPIKPIRKRFLTAGGHTARHRRFTNTTFWHRQGETFHSPHILPLRLAPYHIICKEWYSRTFHIAELDWMIRSSMSSSSSYMFGGRWLAGGCSFSAPRLLCSGSVLMWEAVRIEGRGWKREARRVFFVIKHCAGVSQPASIFKEKKFSSSCTERSRSSPRWCLRNPSS